MNDPIPTLAADLIALVLGADAAPHEFGPARISGAMTILTGEGFRDRCWSTR